MLSLNPSTLTFHLNTLLSISHILFSLIFSREDRRKDGAQAVLLSHFERAHIQTPTAAIPSLPSHELFFYNILNSSS